MRISVIIIFVGLMIVESAQTASESEELEIGRNYTRMFFDDDISPIWNNMTDQMQDALESENSLRDFREKVRTQIGAEKSIVDEQVDLIQGHRVYIRQSIFEKVERPIVISWAIDNDDRIAGFFIRPQQEPAESQYLDYETQAQLQLPFSGEWYVFWGGRDIQNNYHAVARDQRFAYDMVIMKNGQSHSGDGSLSEHYYCWGQPILAPADGTIVSVVADLPDNPPGAMDASNPPGNHVFIDLGNAEFALLAHLQKGSVAVSDGEFVNAGDLIGLCGNSGNTSEPHLHFHIQDQPGFGSGAGKPAFFSSYMSNGAKVDRGEPVRGEFIQKTTKHQE